MSEETGFKVDGKTYEVPALNSFDMDEAQILYDYSGLTLEDFLQPDPEDGDEALAAHEQTIRQKMKNPGFLRALLHVAYRRGNRKLPESRIKDVVRAMNHAEVFLDFAMSYAGDDDDPPAQESTSEHDESSPRSSVDSNENTGKDSTSDSDEPVANLAHIGPTR